MMAKQLRSSQNISLILVPFILIVCAFVLNISQHVLPIFTNIELHFTHQKMTIGLYAIVACVLIALPKFCKDEILAQKNARAALWGCLISVIGIYLSDIFWLFLKAASIRDANYFSVNLVSLLLKSANCYQTLGYMIIGIVVYQYFFKSPCVKDEIKFTQKLLITIPISTSFIVCLPPLLTVYLFSKSGANNVVPLSANLMLLLCLLDTMVSISILCVVYYHRKTYQFSLDKLLHLTQIAGICAALTLLMLVLTTIAPYQMIATHIPMTASQVLVSAAKVIKLQYQSYMAILALLAFATILKQVLKRKQMNVCNEEETTGNFGSAKWASNHDFTRLDAYDSKTGPLIGYDFNHHPLYLALCNKLTIAPPGSGKTTSSSIPVLLSHEGPVFVFDVKGELWAVTARYRSEVLKRKVITIDPYGVIQTQDFRKDKPEHLLEKFCFNPFDWIPEDELLRDRMINAFAASFVINEGGMVMHFDENARILIRGFIDYMMRTLKSDERNLATLFHLLSEHQEQAMLRFDEMSKLNGRAAAAANQISRVGSDERGSILSTSYRQIDWMSDSNIQATLSHSNFDLRDFIKGNMDIYVILPEDQIKEHHRLVRMLFALLMSLLVQANPSDLPQKKMLFLLEELAQLGYCPDVEQCIEVLRARGVVVWTVFQTLSQIDIFKKPDLFTGVPLIQIFTNPDNKTKDWVQKLGNKKTVLTKTLSSNSGDSRKKLHLWEGSTSKGEGESVHETGVDLIQLNQIAQLPIDEQFVFLQGENPIHCKKVRYFEHQGFSGKHDANPIEKRR